MAHQWGLGVSVWMWESLVVLWPLGCWGGWWGGGGLEVGKYWVYWIMVGTSDFKVSPCSSCFSWGVLSRGGQRRPLLEASNKETYRGWSVNMWKSMTGQGVLSLGLHLPSETTMHWLCTNSGVGRAVFSMRPAWGSLCKCLWSGLKNHT